VATIYVYTLRNGAPALLGKISSSTMEQDYYKYYPRSDNGPIWDVTNLKAGEGRLIIDQLVDAPHACPKNIARFTYAWDGSRFVLAGKPAKRKNPSC
jgi:hypothetical protein